MLLVHTGSMTLLSIQGYMWPFALHHAINFHNDYIRKDQTKTPYKLFTGQEDLGSLPELSIFSCLANRLKKNNRMLNLSVNREQDHEVKCISGHSSCHYKSAPLIWALYQIKYCLNFIPFLMTIMCNTSVHASKYYFIPLQIGCTLINSQTCLTYLKLFGKKKHKSHSTYNRTKTTFCFTSPSREHFFI